MKTFTQITSLIIFFCSSLFAQWTLQSTVAANGLYPCISVYSPSGVVIAGGGWNDAKVFISTNSGVNWTNISGNLANTPNLISVWAIDENTIFVGDGGAPAGAGGNAKVWKTTNGGLNWANILSTGGTNGYINGIVFSRTMPSFGIIQSDPPGGAGQSYWIRKTTDGGNTWIPADAPGVPNSNSGDFTVFAIDNMFYGFGIPAYTYLTTDGGSTWNKRSLNIAGSYTSGLAFSSDKTYGIGVTATSLPFISRSIDGGLSWSSLISGNNLSGVSRARWVYGTSTCFIASTTGAPGTIMISTNNGANWNTQTTNGVTGINDLNLFYDSGTSTIYAYAVSASGAVIRLQQSISGAGQNNSLLLPTPGVNTNYVAIPHQSSMIGFGNNITIEGWVKIGSFAAANTLLNKGGTSFDYQLGVNITGNPFFRVQGIVARDSTMSISPGVWTHIAVTYDGATARFYKDGVLGAAIPIAMTLGSSTNEMRIGRGGNDPGSGNIDEVRLWSVARSLPEISSDMCKKWPGSFMNTTGLKAVWHLDSTYTDSISGYNGNPTTGLVGFNAEVPECFVISITYNNNEIPQQFKLYQNFPNPFNPVTKIKFSIPNSNAGGPQPVKLIIYDILGREIASPVNEKLNAGTYEVIWDAKNYSSGIYFYLLKTGDFSQTKKMMLVK